MSASELMEWGEYLSLYPLHEERNELQLAVLSQINASSSKKSYETKDFMVSGKTQEPKKMSKSELNEYILKAMG